MEKKLKRYDVDVCSCVNGPHIDCFVSPDGDWVMWEDVEALLNTSTNQLMEEMGKVLEFVNRSVECGLTEYGKSIIMPSLQKYRGRNDGF